MKIILKFFSFIFFLLIWIKPVLSNEIEFTANEIDTIDKEIIIASGNKNSK